MIEERNTPASSTWQTPMGSHMIAANMRSPVPPEVDLDAGVEDRTW
jgi:hypothetical protein